MKLVLNILVTILCALAVIGCGSYHAVQYYRIETGLSEPVTGFEYPLTAEIGTFSAPDFYQDQIVFRKGGYEMGFYEFSRWIAPPTKLVRTALEEIIRSSRRFQRVDIGGDVIPADIVFSGRITKFDQVLEGEEIFAEFAVDLEAIRSDSVRLIWSASPSIRVRQKGEGKFAKTMSEAVSKTLTEAIKDFFRQPVLDEMSEAKKSKMKQSTSPRPGPSPGR